MVDAGSTSTEPHSGREPHRLHSKCRVGPWLENDQEETWMRGSCWTPQQDSCCRQAGLPDATWNDNSEEASGSEYGWVWRVGFLLRLGFREKQTDESRRNFRNLTKFGQDKAAS